MRLQQLLRLWRCRPRLHRLLLIQSLLVEDGLIRGRGSNWEWVVQISSVNGMIWHTAVAVQAE